MAASGETCKVVNPDEAEDRAVQGNLLSWTPCMLLERQLENDVDNTLDRDRARRRNITNPQGKLAVKGWKANSSANPAMKPLPEIYSTHRNAQCMLQVMSEWYVMEPSSKVSLTITTVRIKAEADRAWEKIYLLSTMELRGYEGIYSEAVRGLGWGVGHIYQARSGRNCD